MSITTPELQTLIDLAADTWPQPPWSPSFAAAWIDELRTSPLTYQQLTNTLHHMRRAYRHRPGIADLATELGQRPPTAWEKDRRTGPEPVGAAYTTTNPIIIHEPTTAEKEASLEHRRQARAHLHAVPTAHEGSA